MKTFLSIFWLKLTHWEYWPWYVVYLPVFAYWLWCGLRAQAIFYLSAVNPGFAYGGIIGTSKKAILDKLPPGLVPKTLLFKAHDPLAKVLAAMKPAGLVFPVVVKPDIGERGFKVELIRSAAELQHYLTGVKGLLLMQEYLDLPMEAGVFYYRMPGAVSGTVSSVVLKGLLTVTGNGQDSIARLMARNGRARLQIKRLNAKAGVDLARVPAPGETVLLEPIGNHVRGTRFIDGNYLITPQLTATFDRISKQVDGFYYGRYDVRCQDAAALCRGDIKIMELNGAASEPAHIYAPGFPLVKGYQVLLHHWRVLYAISRQNHRRGVPYMSFATGLQALRKSRFGKQVSARPKYPTGR